MLTVFENDLGNTGSVMRALKYLNIDFILTKNLTQIEKSHKIIFPGVGSYFEASHQIITPELRMLFKHLVLEKQVPIFGFCLGMQLLTENGEENGYSEGLGLIKGSTKKLRVNPKEFSIPHMGWNDVDTTSLKMFNNVPEKSCFYFVHSYEVFIEDPSVKVSNVSYGNVDICAAFEKDHIWGAQFHPEKSQRNGLELIKNFNRL